MITFQTYLFPFFSPVWITETSKTRIPSRMIHPKFRRATVTNLLVSCSDSKSGDVKDSVEIRNLSSTERERMIEIIQAAKQLEKEEEEALLSKVTNDSEDQKEDKEEDSEGGGSEILSLVKEQQEVSNDDKNVTSKDSQDTNNCNNVFFLEMLIYTSAKKVISVAQKLKPFQLLPESDKMSLLKGSIAEILFLRSTKVFDKESKCWRLPYSFKVRQKEIGLHLAPLFLLLHWVYPWNWLELIFDLTSLFMTYSSRFFTTGKVNASSHSNESSWGCRWHGTAWQVSRLCWFLWWDPGQWLCSHQFNVCHLSLYRERRTHREGFDSVSHSISFYCFCRMTNTSSYFRQMWENFISQTPSAVCQLQVSRSRDNK